MDLKRYESKPKSYDVLNNCSHSQNGTPKTLTCDRACYDSQIQRLKRRLLGSRPMVCRMGAPKAWLASWCISSMTRIRNSALFPSTWGCSLARSRPSKNLTRSYRVEESVSEIRGQEQKARLYLNPASFFNLFK